MKHTSKLLYLALGAGLIFTSCKKDDPTSAVEPGFSTLTVEQNKANIEDAAVSFVSETSGLMDVKAASAADNLVSLTKSGPVKSSLNAIELIQVIAGLNDGTKGQQVAPFLKACKQDPSISSAIADVEGVYTWNKTTGEFDITAATNSVTYLFPFDDASTSNDCEIKITAATTAVSGELTGVTELPSSMTATFKVKGADVSSFTFTASYDSKGLPSTVKVVLNVDTYKWQYTVSQNASKIATDFLFANGATTLINYGGSVTGDLSTDKIETFATDVQSSDEYEAGMLTEAGTYVQNVNMYFQVMNIKMVEDANSKELLKALDAVMVAQENGSKTEKQSAEAAIVELNKYANLYVMYTDKNEKICDAQFYLNSYTDEYTTYEFDTVTYESVEVIVKEEKDEPAVNFVFADGSKSDIESYFETGFADFTTEMENMVKEMENKFDNM